MSEDVWYVARDSKGYTRNPFCAKLDDDGKPINEAALYQERQESQ